MIRDPLKGAIHACLRSPLLSPMVSATAPPAFTPADRTTEIWYDPADEATVTNAGSLVLDDKSGNSRNATVSGVNQSTAIVNGLQAIDFILNGTLVTPTFNIPRPFTMYLVTTRDSGSGSGSGYQRIVNIDPDQSMYIGGYFGDLMIATGSGSSWGNLSIVNPPLALTPSPQIITVKSTGVGTADLIPYFNGQEKAGIPAGSWSGTNRVIRFGGFSNTQFLDGKMCEFILVAGADSPAQISEMNTYLADKWGITL